MATALIDPCSSPISLRPLERVLPRRPHVETGNPGRAIRLWNAVRKLWTGVGLVRRRGVTPANEGREAADVVKILERLAVLGSTDAGAAAVRIAELVHRIAVLAGLDPVVCRDMRAAARFLDLGGASVPDAVLQRREPAGVREQALLDRAPLVGARLATGIGVAMLDRAAEMVRFRRERWDGAGGSAAASGVQIPLSARIVSIAERIDGLNSGEGGPIMSPGVASVLRAEAGGRLDPHLVSLLLEAPVTADQDGDRPERTGAGLDPRAEPASASGFG